MAELVGLDLGTTNTLAGIRPAGEQQVRLFLGRGGRPHPSVIRYHGATVQVGREARDLLEGPATGVIGEFVRSPKQFLGSGTDIYVGDVGKHPATVVSELLAHVRDHAATTYGIDIGRAVATVPVQMDARGRADLRRAARIAGMDIERFVHEPLAALYGYLRRGGQSHDRLALLEGRVVLVFDWGGGTLDLTLCRIEGGSIIQIANSGDTDVGGDRFDQRIMSLVHRRHCHDHGIDEEHPVLPGARAKLNVSCEQAKIRLSESSSAQILVPRYSQVDGPGQVLEQTLTREDLAAEVVDLVDAGLMRIDRLLDHVDIPAPSIELCLATGGMVQMPAVRHGLIEKFGGPGRVPAIPHGDRIIAEGAAFVASDAQPVTLAKPLELLHADDSYVALFEPETELPSLGKVLARSFGMYCVDPRDGYARVLVARPKHPGRRGGSDPRQPYAVAVVAVDPTAAPLLERLEVNTTIDEDLIARIEVESSLVGDRRVVEIADLEFGLKLGPRDG